MEEIALHIAIYIHMCSAKKIMVFYLSPPVSLKYLNHIHALTFRIYYYKSG